MSIGWTFKLGQVDHMMEVVQPKKLTTWTQADEGTFLALIRISSRETTVYDIKILTTRGSVSCASIEQKGLQRSRSMIYAREEPTHEIPLCWGWDQTLYGILRTKGKRSSFWYEPISMWKANKKHYSWSGITLYPMISTLTYVTFYQQYPHL